mmetsp:Transcript_60545/g.169090  ORF Transcript_60545/g.169090 Transcript_60545/m.169090 type:complete len:205 (+) Transcript_60545:578-1192(+)
MALAGPAGSGYDRTLSNTKGSLGCVDQFRRRRERQLRGGRRRKWQPPAEATRSKQDPAVQTEDAGKVPDSKGCLRQLRHRRRKRPEEGVDEETIHTFPRQSFSWFVEGGASPDLCFPRCRQEWARIFGGISHGRGGIGACADDRGLAPEMARLRLLFHEACPSGHGCHRQPHRAAVQFLGVQRRHEPHWRRGGGRAPGYLQPHQ